MTRKQKKFYIKYAALGGTSEEMEVSAGSGKYGEISYKALDSIYKIGKIGKKKAQLFSLFTDSEGKKVVERGKREKSGEKKKTFPKKTPKKAKEKIPNGRSRYDDRADGVAKQILALGGHDLDVQAALRISTATYYRWKMEHPAFHQAVLAGRDFFAVEQVESALIKRATGFEVPYTEIESEIFEDENGNRVEREIKRRHKVKIFAPDTPAAKSVLLNRSPERYSENPKPKTNTEDEEIKINITVREKASKEIPDEFLTEN